MEDLPLRFYLDEQMPVVIASELRRRRIEAITVQDLKLRSKSDETHLQRATAMGYVVCAMDADFVELAKTGLTHKGIAVGVRKDRHSIDLGVRFLV